LCKGRANTVAQIEEALVQNVSEALQIMSRSLWEHSAIARQYAVKIKRVKANILLASETGRAL
jgi:hypothetical protein